MPARWPSARLAAVVASISLPLAVGAAQSSTRPTVTPIASLRVRAEGWDWFDAGPEGRYGFAAVHLRLGAAGEAPGFGWHAELASPMLLGLPDDAVLPGAASQAGLGATYFIANSGRRNVAGLFAKQAFVRVGARSGPGRTAILGRFEFADASEHSPGDPTLAAVRRSRVSQRLIGSFGFTHGQRSFDGLQLHLRGADRGATLAAFRPTAGVFDVDGARQLDVNVLYAALNRSRQRATTATDARLFALHYDDRRGTVPTDSRDASVRSAAPRTITVTTLGGHWSARRGRGDLLVWGVRQFGSWSDLRHAAGALALEFGWRDESRRGQPAIRLGAHRSSGDADPTDRRHETFFQVLPTPRAYALFPFLNLQNTEELFALGTFQPRRSVTVSGSIHGYRLRQGADLWTLGGGAFDTRGFGYPGRAAIGRRDLGTAVTASVAWRRSPRLQFELFGARASGGAVQAQTYGAVRPATFVYLETTIRR